MDEKIISYNEEFKEEGSNNSDDDIDDIYSLNVLINFMDLNLFKKKSRYIFLINDDSVDDDFTDQYESDLFQYIKERIDIKSTFHHINVNKPVTYRGFLTSLTKFSKEDENSFDEVSERLKKCLLTEISRMYIKLKSKDEWKSELKKIITKRFTQLKEKIVVNRVNLLFYQNWIKKCLNIIHQLIQILMLNVIQILI